MATTRFGDGPAMNHVLELERSPLYLRVVEDEDGGIDALDALEDEATPGEKIYAYRRDGEPSYGFSCSRGKGCKKFSMVTYNLHTEQPTDDEARDVEKWKAWTAAQYAKEGGGEHG